MGSLGFSEILVIAVCALFFLGPDRLPQAAKSLGKAISEFRRLTTGARADLEEAIDASGMRQTLTEIRGTVEELNPKRVVNDSLRSLDTPSGTPTPASVAAAGASADSAAGTGAVGSNALLVPPPDADMAEAMDDLPGANGTKQRVAGVSVDVVTRIEAPALGGTFRDVLLDDEVSS
jgi:sec-independent protein translocase protein TatB